MDLLLNHTSITIALGAAVLGAISGALGSFAVLRRQSLMGDAISHAALPGLILAFIITGSTSPLVLMIGAALAGLGGMMLVMLITGTSRVKYDSALGLVLSVLFGFGLVLLTWIQQSPQAAQAGLHSFLFGQAAALLRREVWIFLGIAAVAGSILLVFWKEFKILAFDRDYGVSIGLPMRRLDVLLTGLITISIVLGLQTVGVVLMSAMIIAPAAAARQWTNRLGVMVALAAAIGAGSGVIGAVASSIVPRLPTGPSIILAVGIIVILSLAFAPGRGVVASALQRRRNHRTLRVDRVLTDLYELESQHQSTTPYGHTARALRAMNFGEGPVDASLTELEKRGLVARMGERWTITTGGRHHVETNVGPQNEAEENRR